MPDDRGLPDINSYVDLIDRFLRGSVSAPDFQLTYLRMVENEQRILGDPVFPLIQELFEDADRYVDEPRLRTGTEDLDDEGLMSWAASVRLRLAQTRPVTIGLGLSSKQRRQLALLLRNKHTDHLAAYLRHRESLPIGNAFQPDEH